MGNVIYWSLPYQSPTSGWAVEQNLGRVGLGINRGPWTAWAWGRRRQKQNGAAREKWQLFVPVRLSVPDQLITALRKCVNRRGSPCEPLTQAVEEKHRGGFVVNRSKQRAGSPTKLPSSLSIEQTV